MFKTFGFEIKLGIVSALLFLGLHLLNSPQMISDQKLYPPSESLVHLSLGYQVQLADSFWLRFLQSIDYCEIKDQKGRCAYQNNSWVYQNVRMVYLLDKHLPAEMYRIAGMALSILVNDIEGGAEVYQKGLDEHPESGDLAYAAAYHALYEEKNKLKASRLYKWAYDRGLPAWVQVLSARLAVEEGDVEFADQILQSMINTNQDELLIKRLKEKLAERR